MAAEIPRTTKPSSHGSRQVNLPASLRVPPRYQRPRTWAPSGTEPCWRGILFLWTRRCTGDNLNPLVDQLLEPASARHDGATFLALVQELGPMSTQQLREAAYLRPTELLDSSFLFWLRDRERRPGLAAAERELLSRVGQELTMMREWKEEQTNRALLPSLASSLAYTNLRRWKDETGASTPEIGGVDLEQLYRLGEEEEQKLRASLEQGGGGGLGPRRERARSNIEEFTKHNRAYADLAAGAMARVRARLMGFDDEGPSAAGAVLRALLRQMGSAEERATFLPEAFTPPGLQILPEEESSSSGGQPSFVVTTPDALTAAARARIDELNSLSSSSSVSMSGRPQQDEGVAPSQPAAEPARRKPAWAPGGRSSAGTVQGGSGARSILPSGEEELAALTELLELIDEYDKQVYSRKSPLERMGHGSGQWL